MRDTAYAPDRLLPMAPCRVWRCYTGGLLLDRFLENPDPRDGHTPEDWLASTVQARNGPRSQGPHEGLSRVRRADGTPGPLLRDVLATDPRAYLGRSAAAVEVLCKFLDAAVRLPIQCHPDRAFAREYFHSPHGKAEAWIILDTRVIDGVEPYLLLGFAPGVREAAFRAAAAAGEVAAMERMLHRVPARPGEAYFIPGRLPHAIGPGVLMLEVQEPSDWVVQPEAVCAGTPLSDADMWGPLTPETALSCFAYLGETREALLARTLRAPVMHSSAPGGTVERIIGAETTDCFRVERLTIASSLDVPCDSSYHVEVIVAGSGAVRVAAETLPARRGDVFFVPAGVPSMHYLARDAPMISYRCAPGAAERTTDHDLS